ncbi:OmpA family protein [Variovorax sp. OV329]|uniref:OmpA family protein n=1 Tax=Variovorax sp. OV329 TaxID=1882825 RepID=UPI0008E3483F|nr:OmpA family protein [Variovorax sp. OV329]SFM98608.1 OmpA-OmpF porin, OOP family [Variovorax sp. OV329]
MMLVRRSLAACCLLALPCATGFAQSIYSLDSQYFDDRWYITPFGTYVHPDSGRNADNGWGGGLAVGKPISPYWNIELRSQYEELDAKIGGPGKYEIWSGSLDAQWFFLGRQGLRAWQMGSVQPYLVGGIGAINDKIKFPAGGSDSKTSFMANLGAGVVWPFASWGRLVADARYRYDDNSNRFVNNQSHLDDWMFSVGLQIPLGPAPRMAAAPPPPPPPPAPAMAPPPPPPPAARNFEIKSDGTFEFGKAVLTPTGRSRIDTLMQELKPETMQARSVSIVGFTDPIGSAEYNQRLSVARANSVRDYMVSRGVPANVIQTEGRGKNDLKVTEADCRAQGARTRNALIACFEPNRRVEIRAAGEQTR